MSDGKKEQNPTKLLLLKKITKLSCNFTQHTHTHSVYAHVPTKNKNKNIYHTR